MNSIDYNELNCAMWRESDENVSADVSAALEDSIDAALNKTCKNAVEVSVWHSIKIAVDNKTRALLMGNIYVT